MKRILICVLVGVIGAIALTEDATAQLRPTDDHFESRRRDAEHRQKLREQQAKANQRTVPTFTIPQPSYYQGHGHYNPRWDPRYDSRYFDRDYVFIPGHYQNVYGQMVYVPPRYEYVPRR